MAGYNAGSIEIDCPVGHDLSNPPLGGAREPDGDRLLVYDQASWRLVDLLTGVDEPLVDLAADQGYWLGQDGFGFTQTEGSDWSIPVVSTVTRTDLSGAVLDVVSSPGPFVSVAGAGGVLWVLSEPVGRDYGDPEAATTDRVLWRLASTGAASSVALPVGAAPLEVVAAGDALWLFDEAGEALLYDGSGALTATCALPDGVGEGTRVASSIGAFFSDALGLPTRVGPDCVVTRLADATPAWTFVAADERWLYATEEWAPGPGFTTVHELLALDPTSLEVVGRLPTWREPRAVGGEPVAVLEQTLVVVSRP
jgi:hypothetical protein